MKQLKKLTSRGLKALAKDLELPGYSRLNKGDLIAALKKEDLKSVDFSKYEHLAPTEEKAPSKKSTKVAKFVPSTRRRSGISLRNLRRR